MNHISFSSLVNNSHQFFVVVFWGVGDDTVPQGFFCRCWTQQESWDGSWSALDCLGIKSGRSGGASQDVLSPRLTQAGRVGKPLA